MQDSSSHSRKIVAITQARTGSTRLPAKVLREICGKTLLEHHVDRLNRAWKLDAAVVATTTSSSDDAIVDLCQKRGYTAYRGSEEDVLARYYGAAESSKADIIVRVTSDCPLVDPGLIDDLVGYFLSAEPALDYAALDTRSYPHGLDAEIFSRSALEAAYAEAEDPAEREHVTPFIYRRPERFRLGALRSGEDHEGHRWCVDEQKDFDFVSKVIDALYPVNPEFNWRDCLEVLDDNPEWRLINADVQQKQSADQARRNRAGEGTSA